MCTGLELYRGLLFTYYRRDYHKLLRTLNSFLNGLSIIGLIYLVPFWHSTDVQVFGSSYENYFWTGAMIWLLSYY